MLLRFQGQIEKIFLSLGPGFVSTLPLNNSIDHIES